MKYITSLDDIAPLADQITIRGDNIVPIKALELNEIGALIFKHQSLKSAFEGGDEARPLYDVIVSAGSEVVRDIVDAATGFQGLGARLSGVEQGNIVLSCLNMTIPESEEEMNDFLDQITAISAKAQSLVKARAKKS